MQPLVQLVHKVLVLVLLVHKLNNKEKNCYNLLTLLRSSFWFPSLFSHQGRGHQALSISRLAETVPATCPKNASDLFAS